MVKEIYEQVSKQKMAFGKWPKKPLVVYGEGHYHDNEPPLFTVIKNAVKTNLTTSPIPNELNLKIILDALDLFQHSKWLDQALISEFSN